MLHREPVLLLYDIVELVAQGEGGYIVPPKGLMKSLREICDRHGMLLVADEIQTGFGRTGKMFCMEHYDVEPDIMCLAKGIASGMPLGAVVAKKSVMTWTGGAHGSTFGGNPVSCSAALASIRAIENKYLENARESGKYLMDALSMLKEDYPGHVGDVRGMGLMAGIEFVKPGKDGRPDKEFRDAVVRESFIKGMITLGSGESVLRLCPPLCMSKGEIDAGMDILREAVRKTAMAMISGESRG